MSLGDCSVGTVLDARLSDPQQAVFHPCDASSKRQKLEDNEFETRISWSLTETYRQEKRSKPSY